MLSTVGDLLQYTLLDGGHVTPGDSRGNESYVTDSGILPVTAVPHCAEFLNRGPMEQYDRLTAVTVSRVTLEGTYRQCQAGGIEDNMLAFLIFYLDLPAWKRRVKYLYFN